MKIIKTSNFQKIAADNEFRFRGSIYIDTWVSKRNVDFNIERARGLAEERLYKISAKIPNSYVGGVALLQGLTLDREI